MTSILTDLDADGVLLVTLNRPEHKNLWTADLETAYFDALAAAHTDPDVRVVVVTGAGNTFCPGLDPAALSSVSDGQAYLPNRRPQTFTTTISKPVIAAINGACAGIGLVQALYCDYRFAATGAKMSTAFSRRGLPAEDGTAWIVSRLAGPSKGFDLLTSGRVFLTDEAHGLGLVDELVAPEDLVERARSYAAELARTVSPVSMALIKQQLWHDLGSTLEQARLLSRHLLAVSKLQPDMAEGAASLAERRAPQWPPFEGLDP